MLREQYRVEGLYGLPKQTPGSWLAVGSDDTAKDASSQRAETEASHGWRWAGGDGGEDGIGGGVAVQPVHAGRERLPGWFFLSSCFGPLLASFGVLLASLHSHGWLCASICIDILPKSPSPANLNPEKSIANSLERGLRLISLRCGFPSTSPKVIHNWGRYGRVVCLWK